MKDKKLTDGKRQLANGSFVEQEVINQNYGRKL
jgi:hypothetical protein